MVQIEQTICFLLVFMFGGQEKEEHRESGFTGERVKESVLLVLIFAFKEDLEEHKN